MSTRFIYKEHPWRDERPSEFSATSDEAAVDVLWRMIDSLTEYTTKRYGRRRL